MAEIWNSKNEFSAKRRLLSNALWLSMVRLHWVAVAVATQQIQSNTRRSQKWSNNHKNFSRNLDVLVFLTWTWAYKGLVSVSHCGLLLCRGTTFLIADSGDLPLTSSSQILDCGHFFVLQLQSQCCLWFQPIKCGFSDCPFLAASESLFSILILFDPLQVLRL